MTRYRFRYMYEATNVACSESERVRVRLDDSDAEMPFESFDSSSNTMAGSQTYFFRGHWNRCGLFYFCQTIHVRIYRSLFDEGDSTGSYILFGSSPLLPESLPYCLTSLQRHPDHAAIVKAQVD